MSATYVREIEALSGVESVEGPDWLEPVRQAAREQFARTGFPTTRHEEWRFTPVTPIAQGTWRQAGSGGAAPAGGAALPTGSAAVGGAAVPAALAREQLAPFLFGHPEWTTLVFVNGVYSEARSTVGELASGVRVSALSDALQGVDPLLRAHLTRHAPVDGSPFTALNTAFLREGGLVHVPAGVTLDRPVHLVFVATQEAGGMVTHPRNLIVVERGARATVIESYVTLAPGQTYWTNPVTEVVVGAGAWIEHVRIQRESEQAYHVGLTHVDQQRDSHYRAFSMAMGGALARHNLHVRLNDENTETLMYGLYITRGEQLVDNHTAIFHDQPNCRSWEVYKGILDDRSRAVFNGKVFVKPEAQKTDAKQTNRNLLLSDGAKVDTKPQLEIFADDVRCTHGATVGRLDELGLFYARSRGLSNEAAHRLLTYAFAAEVIEEVALEPVRNELERLVLERLGGIG